MIFSFDHSIFLINLLQNKMWIIGLFVEIMGYERVKGAEWEFVCLALLHVERSWELNFVCDG